VGRALATFLCSRKTGNLALSAWRAHYPELDGLMMENAQAVGFDDFILALAEKLLADSVYGTAYRVSIGALLSTIDAVTGETTQSALRTECPEGSEATGRSLLHNVSIFGLPTKYLKNKPKRRRTELCFIGWEGTSVVVVLYWLQGCRTSTSDVTVARSCGDFFFFFRTILTKTLDADIFVVSTYYSSNSLTS